MMGGYNSRNKSFVPRALENNPEQVKRLSDLLKVKSKHEQKVALRGWDGHQRELQNNQMLKGLFRKLDPTIMKPVGSVQGEIQLSFKYDFDAQMLLVKVIKCRDLVNEDVRAKLSDFYVKMEMVPDNYSLGDRKTQVMYQTTHPRFDEIFSFRLPECGLGDGRLVVHVCEHMVVEDEVRGEVMIDLKDFTFHSEPSLTAWYALGCETDLSISGTLDVSVAFQPPNTLLVTVHGANNLAAKDLGGTSDPFVKVAVPGCDQVFQTKRIDKNLNPVWHETFEFELHEEEIEDKYVIFHVVDHDMLTSNDSLGQCIVDLNNINPELSISASIPLADLRNSERLRTKMHQNRIAQEFKEALIAHSVARAPNCLFKKHSRGEKAITVTCRKAGAQGKLRLLDGIPVYT